MLNNNNLVIKKISLTDNFSKFSLGNPKFTALKTFLQKHAFDFHRYEIAKTFVLVNPDLSPQRVWGYISLMNSEIKLSESLRPNESSKATKYDIFPAVKIARLALDKSLHNQGIGRRILDWCITHVQDRVMPEVGCRFLVVDSKRESISFYKNGGFKLLERVNRPDDEHPLMYIDLYEANQPIKQNMSNDQSYEKIIC